jgi:hypothetical protein
MWFLTQKNKYWNGKEWVTDWHSGIIYGSAAAALKNAPNKTSKATALNKEQWEEHCLACESMENSDES